jgi:hypothetical protein
VLLNNGDATFAEPVSYVVGNRPFSVSSADYDGDADADIAVAVWGDDVVAILSNNGDGTFADPVDFDAGYRPRTVFSADLDGDGDRDLVVPNNDTSQVCILFNLSNANTPCLRGDVNDDGEVNGMDIVYFVNYLWNDGPAPVPCP